LVVLLAESIRFKVWFEAPVALPETCVWLPQPRSVSPPIARKNIGVNCLVFIKMPPLTEHTLRSAAAGGIKKRAAVGYRKNK
jgi:hypothetical protein